TNPATKRSKRTPPAAGGISARKCDFRSFARDIYAAVLLWYKILFEAMAKRPHQRRRIMCALAEPLEPRRLLTAPIPSSDTFAFIVSHGITKNVLANDRNFRGTPDQLNAALVFPPTGGTFSFSPNGDFTFNSN